MYKGLIFWSEQIIEQQALQRDAAPNPILSILNGLGIFSSGVIGAFYGLAQKEKKATDAIVESVSPTSTVKLYFASWNNPDKIGV